MPRRGPRGDTPPDDDVDEDLDDEAAAAAAAQYNNPAERARRREIRSQYRRLIDQTDENCMADSMRDAERIFDEVRNTREAALDAHLMAKIGELARQKAQRFNTNLVSFEPVEYAIKIMSYITSEEQPLQDDAVISVQGWEKLGEAVQPFFKRAPPLQLMYGSFKQEPPQAKPTIRKPRIKDVENTKDKTVPVHVKSTKDDKGTEEATTEQVERILKTLKQYCFEQNNGDPLCYFEFIVNPESFSQTIENMFYVAFLINEGHAKIILDDDRLPLIAPTSPEEQVPEHQREMGRKQVVMSLTKKDWQEIIQFFGITAPLIPSR